jgi:hypothetical protein
MDNDGFQIVSNKRGRRINTVEGISKKKDGTNRQHVFSKNLITTPAHGKELDVKKTCELINKEMHLMKKSKFFQQTSDIVTENETLKEKVNKVKEVVCFGLGSLTSSSSILQLSFLLLVKEAMLPICSRILIYEPILTSKEKEILAQLDIECIDNNEVTMDTYIYSNILLYFDQNTDF